MGRCHPLSGGMASLAAAGLLAACEGPQSALDTAGRGAEVIAELFWWMTFGAVAVWAATMAIAIYATRFKQARHSPGAVRLLIIGGGAVVPTVALGGLLVYSLPMMPDLRAPPPPGGLRIGVVGERWWWRVRYLPAGGAAIESANEIRLPRGERVELILSSPDVIHSLWIPPLGGKVDMIPGRVNTMELEPTETGTFRGACAEYCGASHALMNLAAVVMEPQDFAGWLAGQAAPARPPAGPVAARGMELFLAYGCGACHTVRGTPADGVIGPDLTHVGSRLTLGAGILPNDVATFALWIARTEEIKPDVNMPAFHMLPPDDLAAIARYLEGLK